MEQGGQPISVEKLNLVPRLFAQHSPTRWIKDYADAWSHVSQNMADIRIIFRKSLLL